MHPVWRKTTAVLEGVGGACGSVAVATHLAVRRLPAADFATGAVLLAVYLLALYAGVMLWRGTRGGRVASVLVQLVQLPKVLSPDLAFMVSYGLDVALMALSSPGPSGYGLSLDARAFAHPVLAVGATGLPAGGGFSLVSLLALRLLLRPAAAGPAQGGVAADGHPDRVTPFWLVLAVAGVIGLLAACAGVSVLAR